MRDTFEILSASSRYGITIGENGLAGVIASHPDAIYVVDAHLADRLPDHLARRVLVEAVEENKSLEKSSDYIGALRRLGANRETHLVAIGGGIVQDIVTFVASIYMRGLGWTYMPTTVLAMVDSCIGGKSSINARGYKNLVGNFYPPSEIIIDLNFVTTLDREMIVGGLFESGKICFARGLPCFEDYLQLRPETAAAPADFAAIVKLSLLTKKWFIEIDEFDRKERLLLNFGHTFGHAIEAATDFAVSHGIAVGAGMLCACAFTEVQGTLAPEGKNAVARLKSHIHSMIGPDQMAIAAAPSPIDLDLLMQKFEHDKKHRTDSYRIVIPRADGALALVPVAKTEENRAAILQAFKASFAALGWRYGCETQAERP